ncbi:MAG: amidase [Rubellimicrobium sp.]|nr:amidase [Rubellimicrobium sp.]
MADWHGATAADLGRGIGAGRLDPLDLAEGILDAIDLHPQGAAIYARTTRARALAEAGAARARARSGLRRGLLDGVPLSWKDLYDSAGTATEAGTAMLAGRVPEADCDILANATAGGSVCLGKTHMSEIAFSGLGYNPVTATPPNVHDARLLPGGSSSGAAASVAFGLAPAAVGSDTGGSIRLPSAWNDLVGYKPSFGTLPMRGALPLCASFDVAGPLARSVEDAAEVVALLGGTRPVDLAGASVAGARLLVLGSVVGEDVDEAPAAAFAGAVERLAAAGARITHARADWIARAWDLAGVLYPAEAWAFWRDLVAEKGHLMYHQIRSRIGAGEGIAAADWIAARDELHALRQRFAGWAAPFDAILCPTAPILPPETALVAADVDYYQRVNLRTLRNTRFGNLFDLCGISLPTGTLSCGLLLNGLAGCDGRLLRLAAGAERVLGRAA